VAYQSRLGRNYEWPNSTSKDAPDMGTMEQRNNRMTMWLGKAQVTGSPTRRLEGRSAIVTGAGSRGEPVGVGQAIAVSLAREGADVLLMDIDNERVEVTRSQIVEDQGVARTFVGSVTMSSECAGAVAAAIEAFGKLDILVNNVAAPRSGTVVEMSEDEWDDQLAVNLKSVFLMSKYAIPEMARRASGVIVNVASISAHRATGTPAYSAAKAGIVALTREMALAHGREGIRANTVSPGHISTAWTEQADEGRGSSGALDALRRLQMSPLGTVGGGWDVAGAVVFLCSDDARWITGIDVPVDAGTLSVTPMAMVRRVSADDGAALALADPRALSADEHC
jgi:NAD(P)-dependent dehydrogenase (short-subunit alcohol dehydrogenase family)